MWNLEEAVAYYRKQGAPNDQSALVSLLRELQDENGGGIPKGMLPAVIKRIPSLRIADTHILELCGGPNCSKRARLAEFVEKTYGSKPKGFEVRYVNCMRMCGKGPNIRWDGTLYNGADEALIRRLIGE